MVAQSDESSCFQLGTGKNRNAQWLRSSVLTRYLAGAIRTRLTATSQPGHCQNSPSSASACVSASACCHYWAPASDEALTRNWRDIAHVHVTPSQEQRILVRNPRVAAMHATDAPAIAVRRQLKGSCWTILFVNMTWGCTWHSEGLLARAFTCEE